MTVGILLSNGNEAIAVTDSRVSGWSRHSDSADKMSHFSNTNYEGVTFGSGDGDFILGVFHDSRESQGAEKLESFLDSVHEKVRARQEGADKVYLASLRAEIDRASQLITDPSERKKAVDIKTREMLGAWEKRKLEDPSVCLFSAYDKISKRVRVYSMGALSYAELFRDHFEIGSGADGAEVYLSTRLQGVDFKRLRLEDLAFFALNAHSTSTINRGVGGTPKIAVISNETKVLEPERTVALVNLSGAHLSEYRPLTGVEVRQGIKDILGASPRYDNIANKLGISVNTLTEMCIPYGTWQETANRTLFPKEK